MNDKSNIPSSPYYGVYVSQLILYARACSTYTNNFSNETSYEQTSCKNKNIN